MDKNSLMLLLAQGLSVEKIAERFGKNPSTISYWMAKHGLVAPLRDKHAAKGGVGRDRLEELVCRGLSIARIADEVGLSKTAVRHWLESYELKTVRAGRRSDRVLALAGSASESAVVLLDCASHGETEFILEGRGAYRCRRCRSEAVTRRRRRVKTILVAEAGGQCALCGYDRCRSALAFHHLDPSQKLMAVSAAGNGVALAALRAEARKCVLLCANCHAEVESGAAFVPIKSFED